MGAIGAIGEEVVLGGGAWLKCGQKSKTAIGVGQESGEAQALAPMQVPGRQPGLKWAKLIDLACHTDLA